LRDYEPPFVPELEGEVDTSYFELDGIEQSDINQMIKELDKGVSNNRQKNYIANFTFKAPDMKNLEKFQHSMPGLGKEINLKSNMADTVKISSGQLQQMRQNNNVQKQLQSASSSPRPSVKIPQSIRVELAGEQWFQPLMNRTAAQEYLKPADKGCFVIRSSSQEHCVALSHKLRDGSVGHAVIRARIDPSGKRAAVYQLENQPTMYSSVKQLLSSLPLVYYYCTDGSSVINNN